MINSANQMGHAILINFITPSDTSPAQVSASIPSANRDYLFAFDGKLDRAGNADAAARSAMLAMELEGDFVLAELGLSGYVAIPIPDRYIKARDAVLSVRKAMMAGDLHGNPHAKQWGQQVSDLTDGIQRNGFVSEYLQLITGRAPK